MKNRILFILIIVWSGACASQKETAPAESATASDERESAEEAAARADGMTVSTPIPGVSQFTKSMNAFSFDLLKNLPEENFAVSPIGVFEIGALALAGLDGEPANQLRNVLRIKDTETNIHEDFRNYETLLNERKASSGRPFELTLASQIWATEKHEWTDEFLVVAEKFHGVRPSNKKFADHPAFGTWVATKTADTIADVRIPRFPKNSEMVIGNTTFVRGAWMDPFKRGATKDASFIAKSGKINAPFLNGSGSGRVCEDEKFTLIEMPFRDPLASAWVVLPRENLSSVVSSLDINYFNWAVKNATEQQFTMSVPLFHITSTQNLSKTFQSMGAASILNTKSKDDPWKGVISPANTGLTAAVANASMSFNEHGIFGAEVKFDPGPVHADAKQFVIDRPFLVVVRDNQVGAIVLVARVDNPLKK